MFNAWTGIGFARGCILCQTYNSLRSTLQYTRSYATEVALKDVSKSLKNDTSLFKTYKPITPGIRHLRRPRNDHLWKGKPIKLLTEPLRQQGGRNNTGRITVRFRGGGHKQRIRLVDFMRNSAGPQDVIRIEYDPGRSAHIALVRAREATGNDGKRFAYILAPEGLRAGDVVESFRNGIPDGLVPGFVDINSSSFAAPGDPDSEPDASAMTNSSNQSLALGNLRLRTIKTGNVLPLRLIPTGTVVHNVSLHPQGRARLVRSAGTSAQVVAHDNKGKYTQIRLQSGEVRRVHQDCVATIGKVSNPLWKNRNLGKAGRSRWLGIRPTVRGVAMNKCVIVHYPLL